MAAAVVCRYAGSEPCEVKITLMGGGVGGSDNVFYSNHFGVITNTIIDVGDGPNTIVFAIEIKNNYGSINELAVIKVKAPK